MCCSRGFHMNCPTRATWLVAGASLLLPEERASGHYPGTSVRSGHAYPRSSVSSGQSVGSICCIFADLQGMSRPNSFPALDELTTVEDFLDTSVRCGRSSRNACTFANMQIMSKVDLRNARTTASSWHESIMGFDEPSVRGVTLGLTLAGPKTRFNSSSPAVLSSSSPQIGYHSNGATNVDEADASELLSGMLRRRTQGALRHPHVASEVSPLGAKVKFCV